MARSWGALFLSLAAGHVTAQDSQMPLVAPQGDSGLPQMPSPSMAIGSAYRNIGLDDILPSANAEGNIKCCP
ncbi:hypothetical protein N7499_011027 [Penicillium canescens]|nr:hypothetical protein N7499_011027 [Penicillium canescens]KAJ6182809.1 hypothetical protein N7485_001451 [Penicillium canescens]